MRKRDGGVPFSERISGELNITLEEKARNEDDNVPFELINLWKRRKTHSRILVVAGILLPAVSIILSFFRKHHLIILFVLTVDKKNPSSTNVISVDITKKDSLEKVGSEIEQYGNVFLYSVDKNGTITMPWGMLYKTE